MKKRTTLFMLLCLGVVSGRALTLQVPVTILLDNVRRHEQADLHFWRTHHDSLDAHPLIVGRRVALVKTMR